MDVSLNKDDEKSLLKEFHHIEAPKYFKITCVISDKREYSENKYNILGKNGYNCKETLLEEYLKSLFNKTAIALAVKDLHFESHMIINTIFASNSR